jgi:hypothetical protein
MAHSKDFNGNPVMPGLEEDAFFDFDGAADSDTVPLPLPQMDDFGFNGPTSAYEDSSFTNQLSTAPLDFSIHTAAPRSTGHIGMGTGTRWNPGFEHESSRHTEQLTEEELQIIMAIRAAKQKTAESAISLLLPPVNQASYDFSSPEHPGQVDNFGALRPLSPGGTLELSTNWGDMQHLEASEAFSNRHTDDIQSNS